MHLKTVVIFFLLLFCYNLTPAQQTYIDSLQQVLNNVGNLQKIKKDSQQLHILNQLATSYQNVKPSKMLDLSKKSALWCQNINYETGLVDALTNIGLAYHTIGNISAAIRYYQFALQRAKKVNYLLGLSKLYVRIGNTYIDDGKYSLAFKQHFAALALKKQLGDSLAIAKSYQNIGLIYADIGNHANAIRYFYQALHIGEQIGDKRLIAYNLHSIAETRFNEDNDAEALQMNQRSQKLMEEIGDTKGIGICLQFVGDLYAKELKYEKALVLLQQSLQIRQQIEDKKGIGYSLSSIAFVYEQQKKYAIAIETYQKSLQLKKSINEKTELAQDYAGLSRAYLAIQNKAGALENGLIALKIAQDLKQRVKIRDASKALAAVYEEMGNSTAALQHHKVFKLYGDSLMNVQATIKTTQLQSKYEYEKRENLLIRKYEKQHIEQQWIIACILVSLVFFATISLIIFISRRNINKQKNTVEAQTAALTQANTLKDKLFSIIGHDLRNPIGNLKALLNMVINNEITIAEFIEILPDLNKNVSSIHETLENLLQWAIIQMQGISSSPQNIDIQKIISAQIDLFNQTAKLKSISLLQKNSTLLYVFADENQVKLVLRNLINNAIKFTKNNGSVAVLVAEKENCVEITITDTGVGMSQEQVNDLFSTNKMHTTIYGTNGEKGTGLGLLLCKEMIEKNGGKISVFAKIGIGSSFVFTLPKAKV
jgi:signal transduction histidine kinase